MNVVEARALLVQADLFPGVWPRLREVPSPEVVVVPGGQAGAAWQFEDLLDAADSADPAIAVDSGDRHIVRFSAGTTGRLKGILHAVDGWMRMGQEFMIAPPRTACEDVFLAAGPLSQAASLLLWPMIGSGAALVVMPRFRDPYDAYEPHDRDVVERAAERRFHLHQPAGRSHRPRRSATRPSEPTAPASTMSSTSSSATVASPPSTCAFGAVDGAS